MYFDRLKFCYQDYGFCQIYMSALDMPTLPIDTIAIGYFLIWKFLVVVLDKFIGKLGL